MGFQFPLNSNPSIFAFKTCSFSRFLIVFTLDSYLFVLFILFHSNAVAQWSRASHAIGLTRSYRNPFNRVLNSGSECCKSSSLPKETNRIKVDTGALFSPTRVFSFVYQVCCLLCSFQFPTEVFSFVHQVYYLRCIFHPVFPPTNPSSHAKVVSGTVFIRSFLSHFQLALFRQYCHWQ